MNATITIRDITSGDLHVLVAKTPCVLARDVDGEPDLIERAANAILDVVPVRALDLGEVAYVRSDDEGDRPGTVTWWRSRRIAYAFEGRVDGQWAAEHAGAQDSSNALPTLAAAKAKLLRLAHALNCDVSDLRVVEVSS